WSRRWEPACSCRATMARPQGPKCRWRSGPNGFATTCPRQGTAPKACLLTSSSSGPICAWPIGCPMAAASWCDGRTAGARCRCWAKPGGSASGNRTCGFSAVDRTPTGQGYAMTDIYRLEALPPQLDAATTARLVRVEAATLGHYLHTGFVDTAIRPLIVGPRVAGAAVTVQISGPDSTLLYHAMDRVRPG